MISLNLLVTRFLSVSNAKVSSNYAWSGHPMSTMYRPVSRGVYPLNRRQAGQLGPATLRVSNLLAMGSVLFGAACAAFVPASLEQRIGAVFLFGLIPAIGFHGGGLVLSLLFGFSSELAERIAKLCFRYFARLVSATLPVLKAERSYSSVEHLSELIRPNADGFALTRRWLSTTGRCHLRILMSNDPERGSFYHQIAGVAAPEALPISLASSLHLRNVAHGNDPSAGR